MAFLVREVRNAESDYEQIIALSDNFDNDDENSESNFEVDQIVEHSISQKMFSDQRILGDLDPNLSK